ncbi:MAG: DUF892 family protein [Solirubrobacterales bacterium]
MTGSLSPSPAPVGVAIATRDRRDSLLRTLERLTALPERPPIAVADNASRDGTAAAVAERFPDVRLLVLEQNHGAAARNLAARQLDTPLVAFSDDDSWWEPGALAAAGEIFRRHPGVALVAARILVGEEERRLDTVSASMGAAPTLPGLPGPRIDGFIACGAVVRAAPFLAAGGFCERFVIGAEEGLLTLDLLAAGWELCYAEEVVAVHAPHRSSRGGRGWLERRNELWTSWLRRPTRRALGDTAALVRAATHDATAARALASALTGLPWAFANRRPPRIAREATGRGEGDENASEGDEMFERLDTPEEAFNYKLGASLKMEETVLEILDASIDKAQDPKVKELLRSRYEESRQHVTNLNEAFGLFGWDVGDSPCPAIEGLQKEAKANVKKSDDAIVDAIILQGCIEVEHHEIGVYENLILGAEAMSREDVVAVLERNLGSEQSALQKVRAELTEVAASTPKQPA